MNDEIRIIKQIANISNSDSPYLKELNIVSVNDGPFVYDLREWSLDHSYFNNGITFNNEEAEILFTALKECFVNNGEDIHIDISRIRNATDNSDNETSTAQNGNKLTNKQDDSALINFLKENNIEYIDKREKGGAFWVIGGHELDEVMKKCENLGYKFLHSEKGGKSTKNQPAWYIRAK